MDPCYRRNLSAYFHILEVEGHNNDIINTAMLTADSQIQGHALFFRDFSYLRLYLCSRKDLGVFFHILEVKGHNNDIINNAVLTVDLKMQGHALFGLTSHISACTRAIGKISVSFSTNLRSRITTMIKDILQ